MTRLLVHVEGETEETFANEVIRPHLLNFGYSGVGARLLGNARQRDRRGGIRGWQSVHGDIINHLRADGRCLATTMVDYYGLPQFGSKAWPGREAAGLALYPAKASLVEDAMSADICSAMGPAFNPERFVPYVMMHEFEGLLFSDCGGFARGIGRPQLEDQFQGIRAQFGSPEEINDSPTTAPSKRVAEIVIGYEKPLLGVLAALEIGLEVIRAECPHFRRWLERLEGLGAL